MRSKFLKMIDDLEKKLSKFDPSEITMRNNEISFAIVHLEKAINLCKPLYRKEK